MTPRQFDAAGNIDYDGIKVHAQELRRAAQAAFFDAVGAQLRAWARALWARRPMAAPPERRPALPAGCG
ncbi:MAG TPA: hypothetical protein VFR86_12070 [Burkholderiaceae bacterium]|nr:hypothetical protein [Burkholderiaceae bacterium]